MRALAAAVVLVAAAGCARERSSVSSPGGSPGPVPPAATGAPVAQRITPPAHLVSPFAAETLGAGARVAPALTASAPAAGPAAGATPASGPRILGVTATPAILHRGVAVRWTVNTTRDVARVSAHVATYGFDFQQAAPGRFFLAFVVPTGVPGFMHGTFSLALTASDPDGASASTSFPVTLQ